MLVFVKKWCENGAVFRTHPSSASDARAPTATATAAAAAAATQDHLV